MLFNHAAAQVLLAQQTRPSDGAGLWIIGTWEGVHTGAGVTRDSSRFEFTHDSRSGLRWKMTRSGIVDGRTISLTASGTLTPVNEWFLEAVGSYDYSSVAGIAGRGVRYSFSKNGDVVEGQAPAEGAGVVQHITLRRLGETAPPMAQRPQSTWRESLRVPPPPAIPPLTREPSTAGPSPTTESIARRAAKAAERSVVTLVIAGSDGKARGHGSAFFVSDRVLVTNLHVIEGAARVVARFADGSMTAVLGVVGIDADNDIALVSVEHPRGVALPLGNANAAQVGDDIYAIGSPEGLGSTLTRGIISAIRADANLIQIDAAVSPGSSGGPILNTNGEVVGVVVGFWREGQNLNFAVPVSAVHRLLPPRVTATGFPPKRAATRPPESVAPRAIPWVLWASVEVIFSGRQRARQAEWKTLWAVDSREECEAAIVSIMDKVRSDGPVAGVQRRYPTRASIVETSSANPGAQELVTFQCFPAGTNPR